MLLAELVRTSETVASTPARSAKVAALAALLRRLGPDEVEPAVAFLAGEPRQGKIGVGWATLRAIESPPGTEPSIEVLELDAALTDLQSLTGPGSTAARHQLLAGLLGRATAAEADFIRRLLTGELRQGALEGVMTDAVAKASGVALPVVRRAVMLAGDLGRVASVALDQGAAGLSTGGIASALARPSHAGFDLRRRGSWTALASRRTARVRRCASSPATSTTSPLACPGS